MPPGSGRPVAAGAVTESRLRREPGDHRFAGKRSRRLLAIVSGCLQETRATEHACQEPLRFPCPGKLLDRATDDDHQVEPGTEPRM